MSTPRSHRRKKVHHEEAESHDRWIISYADFITLLFAFFVVMYSVSSVNEGKYRVLSESLTAAFHAPAKSMLPVQIGAPTKSPRLDDLSVRQSPAAIMLPKMPVPKPKPPPATQSKPQDRANTQQSTGSGAVGEDRAETVGM